MDQVFKFDKTFEERLEEYSNMFPIGSRSVSRIKKEWTFYLELVVNSSGWTAIWKMPRLTCEFYKVKYPCMVLVVVESVNFEELIAEVRVLAVQEDDVHLPEKNVVRLVNLWPTKEQDESADFDVVKLATAIDSLRFFYNHIVMPWDYDDEDKHWIDKHLESRLNLYYNLGNGVIPRQTAEYLSSLLSEAKLLQTKCEIIEAELANENCKYSGDDIESERIKSLLQMQMRMLRIRYEVELLENPLTRKVLLQMERECCSDETEADIWLIYCEGTCDDYMKFLKDVEKEVGDKSVKFCVNLITALFDGDFNNTFILSAVKHEIKTSGALEGGGVLKGLYGRNDTVVLSKNDDTMLECNGESVVIENVTLDASFSKYGINVRCGNVTIRNCRIIGNFGSSTQQGITVMSGGKLELLDCEISGFSTGIIGSSNSVVILKNCEIFSVNIGLNVFDKCKVVVEKTNFYNCYEYGICVEMENISNSSGDFSILESVPDIEMMDLTGKNNFKADAVIRQKSSIQEFLNATLDSERVLEDGNDSFIWDEEMDTSDQEMNHFNSTVIENENLLTKGGPI